MWRVEVGDCVSLVTYEVVEAVSAVSVDEAVANPATSAYAVGMLVTIQIMCPGSLTSH